METTSKIYPTATAEIAKMFGIDLSMTEHKASTVSGGRYPGNLPVVEGQLVGNEEKAEAKVEATESTVQPFHAELSVKELDSPENTANQQTHSEAASKTQKPVWRKIIKTALPYAIVFGIGLVLYYFYFSSFSFLNLFKNTNTTTKVNSTQQTAAVSSLEKAEQAKYFAYMAQFYFDADSSVVDPNNDISGNGLTNFQKYLLNLNPKVYDTAGNGLPDGQAIILGLNPVTGRPLTDDQKKIVDAYFDLEGINNRLALGSLHRQTASIPNAPTVLGSEIVPEANQSGTSPSASFGTSGYTAPQTGTQNFVPQSNTVPKTNTQTFAPRSSSSSGSYSQGNTVNSGNSFGSAMPNSGANSLGINTSMPGTLQIPSLNITVPVIWTGDVKNFDSDLQKGVVHYPGTALPGSMGTAYISGHSSGSILNKSAYRKIFDKLNNLPDGGSFTITVTLNSGKRATLHYVVDRRGTFSPTDPAQFANTSDSIVALSTCWPIGTVKDRLVLFGKLTQIEQ